MDHTELHYVTYDPDEIYREMQSAYIEAGGDLLYPGNEKEMLLRAVQSAMVQAFAGVDNALRMATLQYAVGEYLDIYGEKRNCTRIQAAAATATVEIKFKASGVQKVIEQGTALTADGERMYLLTSEVTQSGLTQTVRAQVVCDQAGSAGNGLLAGTQMQFIIPQAAVESVSCVEAARGGQEKEDDETYRERIRKYGLTNVTTGPASQYESAAMGVTSEILDARATNLGAGKVGVALLLKSSTGAEAIIASVKAALSSRYVRPLTDTLTVYEAEKVPYTLKVSYKAGSNSNIAANAAEVVRKYQAWQDETIGRAFNPDRLMADLYQAGAVRVIWGTGSSFDGGEIKYTEIDECARCLGTITLSEIPDAIQEVEAET